MWRLVFEGRLKTLKNSLDPFSKSEIFGGIVRLSRGLSKRELLLSLQLLDGLAAEKRKSYKLRRTKESKLGRPKPWWLMFDSIRKSFRSIERGYMARQCSRQDADEYIGLESSEVRA